MDSTSEHNTLLLVESTPKHNLSLESVYEEFLELPVSIVLAVMWLAGVVIIGVGVLALHIFWLALKGLIGV